MKIKKIILPLLAVVSMSAFNLDCKTFAEVNDRRTNEHIDLSLVKTPKDTLLEECKRYLSSTDSVERTIALGYLANFNPFGDSLRNIVGEESYKKIKPIIDNKAKYESSFVGNDYYISDSVKLLHLSSIMNMYKEKPNQISELYTLQDFSGRD